MNTSASSKRPCWAASPASARSAEAVTRSFDAWVSRISSQRRRPSATGIGPNSATPTSRWSAEASARSSPARRAWTIAASSACSASAARQPSQEIQART